SPSRILVGHIRDAERGKLIDCIAGAHVRPATRPAPHPIETFVLVTGEGPAGSRNPGHGDVMFWVSALQECRFRSRSRAAARFSAVSGDCLLELFKVTRESDGQALFIKELLAGWFQRSD